MTADLLPSLDGRRFVLQSSTTSTVDHDAPSVFEYREAGGMLWGEYSGDTVTTGRFVGTRTGNHLSIAFVHALAVDGTIVRGAGESDVEQQDGRLRLVESYEFEGRPQHSICVETVSDSEH